MSFSGGSFKASLVPAAILSDVSLDNVGMVDDEEEENNELIPESQNNGFTAPFSEDRPHIPAENSSLSTEIINEENESLSLEPAPLLASPNSSEDIRPSAEVTEDLIVEAIQQIRDESSLSFGDSLKTWKEAIALKLNLKAPLARIWNPVILRELSPEVNSTHCTHLIMFLPCSRVPQHMTTRQQGRLISRVTTMAPLRHRTARQLRWK
jgi:hypothetical protein